MTMKCKVCGAESGKYPLCFACNKKKETGEIIKCSRCGNWHYASMPCPVVQTRTSEGDYLYSAKKSLLSKTEKGFYDAIRQVVPIGYYVFPQVNLAAFIVRTDGARFQNELYRNVDFLVTNGEYSPLFAIEINDQTHLTKERRERDEKVTKICEEAGIPILRLWTSYGVNVNYIKGRVDEMLAKLPVPRIHHFSGNAIPLEETKPIEQSTNSSNPLFDQLSNIRKTATRNPQRFSTRKAGCYVATCVYGTYDCPQVWMLRRYRDNILAKSWYGRAFIRIYYRVSPGLVKWFGQTRWFRGFFRGLLEKMIDRLQARGIASTPYEDRMW